MPEINLFPKQAELLDMLEHGNARIIGLGGGRGASKSGSIDRVALTLALETPGTLIAIIMRNADQVRKYHIETMMRTWPDLQQWMHYSHNKLVIPHKGAPSQIDFTYSESMEDTKRRFRSANYRYLFLDQSEQWMGDEIREMMNANRGARGAKTVLSFNLGGIGIQDHRKWFHEHRYNERDDPENYAFIKINPWDNYIWAKDELADDGLTMDDYYSWSDSDRFRYFTSRTEYGRQLNALDDSLRARDLLGSWESLEGAYFGRVFDYKATLKPAEVCEGIIRPWDSRWLSTDWGKTHFCSTHWHGKSLLTPSEVKKWLGWDVPRALTVVSTYRRNIVNEQTSSEVARGLIDKTPRHEREQLKRYPFSPEQFGERDSEDTVPIIIGRELAKYGMPHPEQADNSRKPGWLLMYELLNNTRIWATEPDKRTPEDLQKAGDTVWIISSECPEALETIPVLMRNEKDLDDVVKQDKGQTVMAMDVADDLRYGLQSTLGEGRKPDKVVHGEAQMARLERLDYQGAYFAETAFRAAQNGPQFQVSGKMRRR